MRKLLDAAIEVFARKGFHATRVDDIVKAADMSHGSFYLYFANKEDLFRALTEEVAGEATEVADSLGALSPDATGKAELRDWLERFGDLYERFRPVIQVWTEAETAAGEAGRIGTELLAGFTARLAQRIEEGGARDIDPQLAAIAIVAMVERYHYYALSGFTEQDRSAVSDDLATMTHAALFGVAAGHRS